MRTETRMKILTVSGFYVLRILLLTKYLISNYQHEIKYATLIFELTTCTAVSLLCFFKTEQFLYYTIVVQAFPVNL